MWGRLKSVIFDQYLVQRLCKIWLLWQSNMKLVCTAISNGAISIVQVTWYGACAVDANALSLSSSLCDRAFRFRKMNLDLIQQYLVQWTPVHRYSDILTSY